MKIELTRHAQSFQNKKFAYLCNGVHFLYADKHQSFCKLALSFLMEMARHVQSSQKGKLVIFLQYIKKKVSQLLLCSDVMQNIQIFYGGPFLFVVTCYL